MVNMIAATFLQQNRNKQGWIYLITRRGVDNIRMLALNPKFSVFKITLPGLDIQGTREHLQAKVFALAMHLTTTHSQNLR